MAKPDLPILRALRSGYAVLALSCEAYLPVFERIDRDCADAETLASNDPVAVLRAQIERSRREAA